MEKLELWQKDLWRATLTPREVNDLIVFLETRPRLMAGRRCFYGLAFEFPVLPTDLDSRTYKGYGNSFPTMHDQISSALAEFENMRAPRRWQREHFTAAGMPSQRNQSESFRFKRAAFYQGLKSKVGLAAAKAAALRSTSMSRAVAS